MPRSIQRERTLHTSCRGHTCEGVRRLSSGGRLSWLPPWGCESRARVPHIGLRPRRRGGGGAAQRFNSSTAAAAEAVVGEGSGNETPFTAAAPRELPKLADAGARAPSG